MDMNINDFIIGEEYIIYYPIYGDMIKKIMYGSGLKKKTRECAIKEINNNESNICNFIKDCVSYKCVLNEIIIDDNDKYFRLIFKLIKIMSNNSGTKKYINEELIEITGFLKDNIINSNCSIISFKKYDKIYKEKLIEDNFNKNYNKTMAKLLYNIYDKLEIDITDILKDS